MNYQNLYQILKYAQKNDINITFDLLQVLKKKEKITSDEFPILYLSTDVSKFYFEHSSEELMIFLKNQMPKLSDNELINCAQLIAAQETRKKQEQIRLVCENDAIRQDKEVLKLIVSQDNYEKRKQLILACENGAIRQDKEALKLIAGQDNWFKLVQMRLACEVDGIRIDKEILKLIASQDSFEKQEQIRLACEKEAIRQDKEALMLIASQDSSEKQRQMRLFYEREATKQDEEALKAITEQNTAYEPKNSKELSEETKLEMLQNELDVCLQNVDISSFLKTYEEAETSLIRVLEKK